MEEGSNTPLCGKEIFLYPGDPDGTGMLAYDTTQYRDRYDELQFADSTQFISSLEENIRLENRSLLRVAEGERFVVPEYQRNFTWEEDQHEELWNTILSIQDLKPKASDLPVDTYFGTVYVARDADGDVFEIIDGQQRLTTVAIILKNLKQQLEARFDSIDGQLLEYAQHVCDRQLEDLLYRADGPDITPFITLNDHDQPFFDIVFKEKENRIKPVKNLSQYDGRKTNSITVQSLLDELDIPKEAYEEDEDFEDTDMLESYRYYGDAHRRLINADKFYKKNIRQFIEKDIFETPETKVRALLNLTHYILRSLRVSECIFETSNQELRIEVFQSLNDRGVELSNMDKIRARVVGRFQGESDSDVQIDRWESVVKTFGGDSDDVEDFLAHYLAATEKEFSTVTEAKNEMLEAFRLKQIGHHDIQSRLASPGQARDFLEELVNYAQRYREIVSADLTDDDLELKDPQKSECEEILKRLNKLGTKQWRPFVMYVYQAVTEAPQKDQFLVDVLKTVEDISFRFSISDLVGTVVDDTYPNSCQEFRELEQTGNQFDSEEVSEILIENIDNSARQMFGESFIDRLVSKDGWNNNKTKQLYLKVADEDFRQRNEVGITNSHLSSDSSEVHIEHVLPVSYILAKKDHPYAWLEHFFRNNGDNKIRTQIDYLQSRDAHELSPGDDGYDEIERVVNGIEERFVRDIGNMILLDEEVNRPIQNRLFAVKLKEYHKKHDKDMENIINQYFGTDGAVDESKLQRLLTLDMPDDETRSTSPSLIQDFNEWWTYERLVQRKSQLVSEILESLTFSTRPDEFEPFVDDLENIVEEDVQKRLAVLTV